MVDKLSSIFKKDSSFVNKILFPAPKPPLYDHFFFDKDTERGALCYIPRHEAARRRADNSGHDRHSVSVLCSEVGGKGLNAMEES